MPHEPSAKRGVPDGWTRVTRENRCPICGRPDLCLLRLDGVKAACGRTPSEVKFGNFSGAWVHVIDANQRPDTRSLKPAKATPARSHAELEGLQRRYTTSINPPRLVSLARSLGLTVTSLQQMGIGHNGDAWTFPMFDGGERLCGFRIRGNDGAKWSLAGSRNGLFVPTAIDLDPPLHICEGATSCAALVEMGFSAIGRPSCSGGLAFVRRFIQRHRFADVVVWGDRDEQKRRRDDSVFYPGQEGARALALELVSVCRRVRVCIPPAKDARAWLIAGADAAAVHDYVSRLAVMAMPQGERKRA